MAFDAYKYGMGIIDFHITEVSITLKLWKLIVWYCLEPHCIGYSWHVLDAMKSTSHTYFFSAKEREKRTKNTGIR